VLRPSHLSLRETRGTAASPGEQALCQSPKKTRFLEFVSEQAFLGNGDNLNEYLIGVEVYGRGSGFNAQEDPIVRVQAHEIRRSLKQYYEEDGKDSLIRINLPLAIMFPSLTEMPRKRQQRRNFRPGRRRRGHDSGRGCTSRSHWLWQQRACCLYFFSLRVDGRTASPRSRLRPCRTA